MNTYKATASSTLLLAAMTAPTATADDVDAAMRAALLADAASYPAFVPEDFPSFTIGGLLQTRYTISHVEDSDDVTGFSIPRARLWIKGEVTESIGYYVRGQFSGEQAVPFFEEAQIDGILELDRAYISFALSENYSLRAGQQVFEMSRENEHAPQDQLGVNASATDSVFGLGAFKGIQLHGRFEDWRFWGTYNDGSRNTNTSWAADGQADFGLTGKVDYKFSGEWSQFGQFTSFRESDFAAMIGLGAHWEDGAVAGDPAAETQLFQLVTELSLEGNGWNFYGAFHWSHNDFQMPMFVDDFGVVAQGGYFVTDDVELYGRYDVVLPDSERADNPMERGGIFQTLTAGCNHYITPASNSLKLSGDVVYFFDSEADSLVQPSDRTSVRASDEGGQFAFRLQISAQF